jgi:hypothetical protein
MAGHFSWGRTASRQAVFIGSRLATCGCNGTLALAGAPAGSPAAGSSSNCCWGWAAAAGVRCGGWLAAPTCMFMATPLPRCGRPSVEKESIRWSRTPGHRRRATSRGALSGPGQRGRGAAAPLQLACQCLHRSMAVAHGGTVLGEPLQLPSPGTGGQQPSLIQRCVEARLHGGGEAAGCAVWWRGTQQGVPSNVDGLAGGSAQGRALAALRCPVRLCCAQQQQQQGSRLRCKLRKDGSDDRDARYDEQVGPAMARGEQLCGGFSGWRRCRVLERCGRCSCLPVCMSRWKLHLACPLLWCLFACPL